MTEQVYLRPMLTRPVLARPRGPLARGMALDDAVNFKEGDHPRDSDGKFKSGAAAASAVAVPPAWMGIPGKAIQSFAVEGLKKGESPQSIADKLKQVTQGYKHGSVAVYANNIIKLLEQHHSLKPGHLGKAVPQAKPDASKPSPPSTPAAKAPPSAPKPSVNLPVPPPPAPGATQAPTPPGEPKKFQLSPAGFEKPAATPEPPSSAKGPIKYPDAPPEIQGAVNAMKAVINYGTATESKPQSIIDGLKGIAQANGNPAVTDYANGLIKQIENQQSLTPSPVMALPPKLQTEAPAQAGVTKPPASSRSAARARDREAKARSFPSASYAGTAKIIPSLQPDFWKDNPAARSAASAYSGSSYMPMNQALRGAATPAESILEHIHALDDAFEHPDASVTDDVILRRGENVPDMVLAEWEKKLKAGIPCRMMKEGFVSASLADEAAFGGKNTQFQMLVRKGTPALGVHQVSLHKSENEILLRHGQAFEVYEIKRGKNATLVKVISV